VRTSSATNVGQTKTRNADSGSRSSGSPSRRGSTSWSGLTTLQCPAPIRSKTVRALVALIAAAWWLVADARLAFVGSLYLFGALGNLWGRRGLHPGWMLMTVALVLISKPIY
jgi:hypothetical protein